MNKSVTKFRFEQSSGDNVFKLYVYDNVTANGPFNWESWCYDESETSADFFLRELNKIPEDGKIDLHINSYGGDVKEGVAIYNMLKRHGAYKTCYVDGFAYSVASVICMACDKIIMGLGTSMMIHNISVETYGNAAQLRKMADDLDVLMESNRKIYMARAKDITEEQLADMMNAETFLTPEQCLAYGFCDEVGTSVLDESLAAAQNTAIIQQLRQQINAQKSFREEIGIFIGEQRKSNLDEKLKQCAGNDKVLKMMGAFFNAVSQREAVEQI